ncbi:MAG: hypothetical protein KDC98_24345 [Planctomycetes bacterium]|nr:hypothetical protein [Planctomycetota bacterium]
MKRTLATTIAILALTACTSGKKGPPTITVSTLAGTWVGQYVELDAPPLGNGPAARIELVLTDDGSITSVRINGDPNGTGRVTPVTGQSGIFDYQFSLGGEGGFYVDASGNYAAAVDEEGTVAILHRGASGLPSYVFQDAFGTWSGESIYVSRNLDFDSRASSQLTVGTDGNFSGTEDGQPFSSLDPLGFYSNYLGDPSLAFWWARYSSLDVPIGIGRLLMSSDKQFMAGFLGENGGTFPSDFSFPVWHKQ